MKHYWLTLLLQLVTYNLLICDEPFSTYISFAGVEHLKASKYRVLASKHLLSKHSASFIFKLSVKQAFLLL